MKAFWTILALILACAGVAAVVRTCRHEAARTTAPEASQRLVAARDMPLEQVNRITLERNRGSGNEKFVFVREGTQWRQMEPFSHPMDAFSIQQMIVAARELEVIDRLALATLGTEQSLAALHLAPPAGRITYQWPSGSLRLDLGRRSVAGRAYLRREGDDRVCIVNQKLHERCLEMSAAEWRDKRIFFAAGAESDRIEWQQAGADIVLQRTGRRWNMLEPVRTRVDGANLEALLQAMGRATVSDFILELKNPAESANFGLENPTASLTVHTPATSGRAAAASTKPQTIERLVVGSRTGATSADRFGLVDGREVIVRLSEPVLAALFRAPETLVSPTGSGVNAADVKAIEIRVADADSSAAGGELRLERDLERWRAPAHGNAEVNAAQVRELLDQITRVRAESIEFRDYPRDLEVASITLYGFDQKALDTVRIAREPESDRLAMENGDNVLRIFPSSMTLRLRAADFGLD